MKPGAIPFLPPARLSTTASATGKATEARLRAVLDAALDAVIGMGVDDVITYWNPRAEAIFGWTRTEALGRRVGDLIIPERYREAHRRGLKHFMATGEGPVLNRQEGKEKDVGSATRLIDGTGANFLTFFGCQPVQQHDRAIRVR